MAGHPSNRDGAEGDKAHQPDSGLDAKLDRAVPAGRPEAYLLGVGGAHGGRIYPLSHNTIFIGRADDADVNISDPSVSARHARLINGSQGFEIEDLGSTNGTLVEGRPIVRARLKSGDRIDIGQVEFKFLLDRRVDATMTIIPPGMPADAPRMSALIRYEPPRPRGALPPPRAVPQSRDEDEGMSFEDVVSRLFNAYRFLRANRVIVGALAAAGVFAGLLSVIILPAAREAYCLVRLQAQVKTNPFDGQQNRQSDDNSDVRFFAGAENAFVMSDLVAATLKQLTGQAPSESTVTATVENLKFEPLPDHVYRATYRERLIGRLPFDPATFLTAHLQNYLRGEIDRALRVFSAQAEFLRGQLRAVEGDMNKVNDQKMQFSQKNSDRLPEEAEQTLESRFTLETKRAELLAQVRRLEGELEAQRQALAAESPLAQSKRQSSQIYRDSLASINSKLSEAYAQGLADGHPEVQQLKAEKARIETLIDSESEAQPSQFDKRSNAGYQDIKNRIALVQGELSAARNDLADTESNLGRVQKVVGDLPRVQAGVQELTHMQEATTQLHSQLFEQLKKAELQLNLERVSAESRYEVVLPPRITKVGHLRTAALRCVIGLFVGLFVAAIILAFQEGRRILLQTLETIETSRRPSRP
jgi:Inner membrane component of T3SS, cytoplasmic domain